MSSDLGHPGVQLMDTLYAFLVQLKGFKLKGMSAANYDLVVKAFLKFVDLPNTHRYWFDEKVDEIRSAAIDAKTFDRALTTLIKQKDPKLGPEELEKRLAEKRTATEVLHADLKRIIDAHAEKEPYVDPKHAEIDRARDVALFERLKADDGIIAKIKDSLIPPAQESEALLSRLQDAEAEDD